MVRRIIHKLILGELYACRASLCMERTLSGRVTCTITLPNSEITVRFVAAQEDTVLLGESEIEVKD